MNRRRVSSSVSGCASAFVALTSAAIALAEPVSGKVNISQKNRRFAPDAITIPSRATLRVLNDDRFIHHVFYEANARKFDSGDQRPGQAVDLSFAGDGVYHVKCAIHPKMKLTVRVGVAAEELPAAK